jgi:hypothetical protein
MADVTIREIRDLRELAEPPAPSPDPDPDKVKANGEELLAEAQAVLARLRACLRTYAAAAGWRASRRVITMIMAQ